MSAIRHADCIQTDSTKTNDCGALLLLTLSVNFPSRVNKILDGRVQRSISDSHSGEQFSKNG